MKITKELVADIAHKRGYEPVQIDGIPEGFSWMEPDVVINDVHHKGRYVAFVPLKNDTDVGGVIRSEKLEDLLAAYKDNA